MFGDNVYGPDVPRRYTAVEPFVLPVAKLPYGKTVVGPERDTGISSAVSQLRRRLQTSQILDPGSCQRRAEDQRRRRCRLQMRHFQNAFGLLFMLLGGRQGEGDSLIIYFDEILIN